MDSNLTTLSGNAFQSFTTLYECKIGDEEHYLLYCKYFNQQRQLYLGDVRALEILFNDNKTTIQYNLANFVSYIMNEFK